MDHLYQLRKVNDAFAWFNGVVGAIAVVGLAALALPMSQDSAAAGWLMVGTAVFVGVLMAALVVLTVLTGRRVEQGRWRMVQTVLALLQVSSNPPVGTAYGAYALWVCWAEPGAVARFTGATPPPPPSRSPNNLFYTWVMRLIVGFGIAFALLTAAALGGTWWALSWGAQEPEVLVTGSTVEITGMYGEVLQQGKLSEVELRDQLPYLTARTNGYALGGTLKGWYATPELGRVKLFVHADTPPFLYLHGPEHWVIYGSDQPDQTRAVYEQLRGASR